MLRLQLLFTTTAIAAVLGINNFALAESRTSKNIYANYTDIQFVSGSQDKNAGNPSMNVKTFLEAIGTHGEEPLINRPKDEPRIYSVTSLDNLSTTPVKPFPVIGFIASDSKFHPALNYDFKQQEGLMLFRGMKPVPRPPRPNLSFEFRPATPIQPFPVIGFIASDLKFHPALNYDFTQQEDLMSYGGMKPGPKPVWPDNILLNPYSSETYSVDESSHEMASPWRGHQGGFRNT